MKYVYEKIATDELISPLFPSFSSLSSFVENTCKYMAKCCMYIWRRALYTFFTLFYMSENHKNNFNDIKYTWKISKISLENIKGIGTYIYNAKTIWVEYQKIK